MINVNSSNIHTWAILDSGATSHFLVTMATKSRVSPTNDPLRVSLPNGDQVQSTHTCILALPQLPAKARFEHIVPGLAEYSLLSVVKICDAGCDITFTKINCTVRYRERFVMIGSNDTNTGLWMLLLEKDGFTISKEVSTILAHMPSQTNQPIAVPTNLTPTHQS